MAVLQLQRGIIYGPINSRRLGRSLGVNLLPASHKLCSFDCVYCHYGRTKGKTLRADDDCLPRVEEVYKAVGEALQTYADVDYITLSGNGEPTLHPRFSEIVFGVRRLRDELRPAMKLAILSNSSGLHYPQVRESLRRFDTPIMKLDAGDRRTLASINRPAPEVRLDCILEGLKGIPDLVIQSVLVGGKVSNVGAGAFQAWLSALAEVKPAQVQIYSTDRPVPEAGVERLPPPTLQHIAAEVQGRIGIPARAYWAGM